MACSRPRQTNVSTALSLSILSISPVNVGGEVLLLLQYLPLIIGGNSLSTTVSDT
jgi:hypothetical protein